MSDNATVPVVPLNHERVTDSILREASRRASVTKRGTEIIIDDPESRSAHDDTIRMLLTAKVRTSPTPLRYRSTLCGKHTFFVP